MSNLVRRIVSGNKARFKDKQLDLELDLVYVTDHIIVMGFPASGVEGFYRNRREDAKRFLDHRHGKDYWVFNFCPLRENSYPASFFDGRVSRYPFPDHHAPPLAILPLFVREVREWLSGSPERVAVLHCKAGKGRSGTLACAYLLSLDDTPEPPKLQRSMTKKEWAQRRADQIMKTVETEEMNGDAQAIEETRIVEEKHKAGELLGAPNSSLQQLTLEPEPAHLEAVRMDQDQVAGNGKATLTGKPATETPSAMSPVTETQSAEDDFYVNKHTLDDVLALHTARRMKSPSSPDKNLKQGVSIPSQRRWLYYWSLLLAHAEPHGFWQAPLLRVRLREMRVRVRDVGGVKMNLLKFANHLIDKTNATKYGVRERGQGPLWISLARYNDEFVDVLEKWEKHTRSEEGNMGKKRRGSEDMPDGRDVLREIFTDGKWDEGKMIRSFTRLGHSGRSSDIQREEEGVVRHTLRPLSDQKWEELQEEMVQNAKTSGLDGPSKQSLSEPESRTGVSTASSATDLVQVVDETNAEKGVILDAAREVRAKLYMGQVFMGWFWFIPAFHMTPPPVSSDPEGHRSTELVLSRKQVDFPIGIGANLVDVVVVLEWVVPGLDPAADRCEPPKTQTSEDSVKGLGGEPGAGPGGVVASIQAAVFDGTSRKAVEAAQATDQ